MDIRELFSDYINRIIELTKGCNNEDRRFRYNNWLLSNMKSIEMDKFSDLAREVPRLDSYLKHNNVCQVGKCFVNSGKLSTSFPNEFIYCEGYFFVRDVPIPFEHAWIKYKDKYYDPTFSIYGNDDNVTGYILIREFDSDELLYLMVTKRCNGPYLENIFNKMYSNGKV
jgi:hypothetical protein